MDFREVFVLGFCTFGVFSTRFSGAKVHVLGSAQLLRVFTGQDVVLPCRCEPPQNLSALTVEWSSSEFTLDSSEHLKEWTLVHVYMDQRQETKSPELMNRTTMFLEQLRAGNASLRIQSLRQSDSGTYKCSIPNLTEPVLRTEVTMEPPELRFREAYVRLVVLTDPHSGTDKRPFVVLIVVISVLVYGSIIYK